MPASADRFYDAIGKTKIPILILDNKWHRIFGKMNPTKEIVRLEKELGELLKRQGKLTNENKDLKKIKSDLMKDIVDNMDGIDNSQKDVDKKMSENNRLISDANARLAANEDELMELPRQIDKVNKELMLATMEMCYERLQSNTSSIEEIAEWIKDIRIQLKKNIVKKQDMELYNAELYSYMHDIFGPEVMEIFDMKYVPTLHKMPELKPNTVVNAGAAGSEDTNDKNKLVE